MKVFIIITALICIVGFAWHWLNKPVVKGAAARFWPASRGKLGAKPRLP